MINHILAIIALATNLLGKIRDEHDGNIFIPHIGLKPKMYCCGANDRKALKKGKGMDRTNDHTSIINW